MHTPDPDRGRGRAPQLLVKWWSDYPGSLLEARVVAPMQSYLTKELMATKKLTIGVMNAIKVVCVCVCVLWGCVRTCVAWVRAARRLLPCPASPP
jgi:hypothetical protein